MTQDQPPEPVGGGDALLVVGVGLGVAGSRPVGEDEGLAVARPLAGARDGLAAFAEWPGDDDGPMLASVGGATMLAAIGPGAPGA